MTASQPRTLDEWEAALADDLLGDGPVVRDVAVNGTLVATLTDVNPARFNVSLTLPDGTRRRVADDLDRGQTYELMAPPPTDPYDDAAPAVVEAQEQEN